MSTSAHADLVVIGRVATLAGESGYGWRRGFAVRDGRVVRVAEESELDALVGPRTETLRLLDDEIALPGLTDAHLHLMTLILAEWQIDLTGLDRQAALDAIAAADAERRASGDVTGWLLGHGWSMHGLGGWPDAEMLEGVAPGRPIALYAHDHHARWVSRTALRLAQVDGPRGAAAGGLVRRDERGVPTGMLHESAASLVDAAIPDPGPEQLEEGLRVVAAKLATLGLTGVHDPGELNDDRVMKRGPVFYRELAAAGRLPLRVHGSIRAPQLDRAIELRLRSGERTGRYTTGWLKLFADGSLGSRSAALLEPYEDAATNPPTGGPSGMVVTDAEELADLLGTAARAGIVGQVHAIGDAAVRMALDALTPVDVPDSLLRRRIEHAQLVDPADQGRFGALGIAASVQPVHLRSDAPQERLAWGERAENSFPLRTFDETGALMPFGTDAPVEPADPWPGIAVAVVRRDPSDAGATPMGREQSISLSRAIRAACLDPARVAGRDDLGRLVPGCAADFVIVPAAPFREGADPSSVASLRPRATFIDGERL